MRPLRSERARLKELILAQHRDWAGLHAALRTSHGLSISQSSLDRFFAGRSHSPRTLRTLALLLGTAPDLLVRQLRLDGSSSKLANRSVRIGLVSAAPLRDRDAFRVAYQLWVEMTTRKLGLPIDPTQDSILECYDSWYAFFKSARELTKAIPLHKNPRSPEMRQLIQLSQAVLNDALRPHLQRWQIKFRAWVAEGGDRSQAAGRSPQERQQLFPEWIALREDLLATNRRLIGQLAILEIMVGRPAVVQLVRQPKRRSARNTRRGRA